MPGTDDVSSCQIFSSGSSGGLCGAPVNLYRMLDPFTALSLASSVIQFVDFGVKLLNESAELYHPGSLLKHEDFETITNDLIDVNALLENRPRLEGGASNPAAAAEHVGWLPAAGFNADPHLTGPRQTSHRMQCFSGRIHYLPTIFEK